jgi:magnesium transporter
MKTHHHAQQVTRKRASKAGLPPGSLVFVGERRVEKATISVIDYTPDALQERTVDTPADCRAYVDSASVTWINVTGLHDTALMRDIGELFAIHPLTLEDIVHTGQRPKTEDQGSHIFMVLEMLYRDPEGHILAEQISLILGRGYVLSFQEVDGDVFGTTRERIRSAKGRIRRMGTDYLAYSLLDAIVDNYFVVLEDVSDRIEQIQDDVLAGSATDTLARLHRLKREMIFTRKHLWPVRELVSGLAKSESDLLGDAVAPYLRDVYEHTIQVIDTVETLRDMLSGALDIYMTNVSNRMNEVMKLLTIIATIFIPLTFIAGVYGMNFEYMPELGWRYGYAGVWLLMLAVGAGLALFFKHRKWL